MSPINRWTDWGGRGLLASDTQLNRSNFYEATVQRPPALPPLQGRVVADAAVVGGGFAGLSAALALAQRGQRVVLLEADRVCSGASGRNGGQALVGFACGQEPFERHLGRDQARLAWNLSLEALSRLDAHADRWGIACDRVKGYLTVAETPRKARALAQDVEHLHRELGFAQELALGPEVARFIDSPRYAGAAFERTSGHLHPLKYGLGLLRAAQALGVQLHESTPALRLDPGPKPVLHTPQGQVQADRVVLAGNCLLPAHAPQLAPQLSARIMPVGTYIVATAPLPPEQVERLIAHRAAVCDTNTVLDYFRFSADGCLLFGGRVSYTTLTPPGLQALMQRRMLRVFPALAGVPITHLWGGFVDISMNRAPDFGRLADNVVYLQGFSGHGVALTALAGELAAEALAGQAERFDVFARLPHRPFPGGPRWRTPTLALGMLWHRLKDLLG